MKLIHCKFAVSAVLLAAVAAPAYAVSPSIIVSEVAPWSSGNSTVAADWFEVTNTGATAVTITDWKVDDNSNSSGAAVALRGVTSIAAGESVIFIEGLANGSTDTAIQARFVSNWFGGAAPSGLQIGNYGGSGIGLSTGGDAVNLFDAGGTLVTRVAFGPSPAAPGPFTTFDNAVGLDNVTLTSFSAVGVHGAFAAVNAAAEIGSPGRIAAVPEPETYALMLAGLLGLAIKHRRRAAAR